MNHKKPKQSYTTMNALVTMFLLLMFAAFPLFVSIYLDGQFPFIHFDDGFIGIRHQKFYFFIAIAALALIAELMLLLTGVSRDKEKKTEQKAFWKTLSFTDWAAAALALSCALSTLFSPYISLAFWGEMNLGGFSVGRNNGLFLILFYVAVYFMLSRLFRFREVIFVALAASSSIVSLLTVLNGFYIDPLNMLAQFKDSQPGVYMEIFATIGNKNMLASFICVTLPVSFVMSVLTESLWKRALYITATALGMMAMIIGDSDSALLGSAVFLAVMLVVFARRPDRLKRFFLALTVMAASVLLLRLFSHALNDNYKELGDLTKGLLFSDKVIFVTLGGAVITALLYLLDQKKPDMLLPKAVPVVLGALFGGAAIAAFGVFIYFSAIDTSADLGSMEKLLRMNDAWGTHRGIMWLRSFKIFSEANVWQKLFGMGPDTFYFAFEPYFKELEEYGNSSTDAAHNEYINYLITIGAAGLLSYLAFTGSALVRGLKNAKAQPYVLPCCAAVIAYLAQATVNIALPISTPLFIIFVSLCEAFARQAKEKE